MTTTTVTKTPWTWTTSRTKKAIEDAKNITCLCVPKKKLSQITTVHESKCPVSEFPAWKAVEAEWVPALEKIVFYAYKGGKSGQKELVTEDNKIVPKFKCWCKMEASYTCTACGVTRDNKNAPWRAWGTSTTGTSSYSGSSYTPKDRHYGARLTFPDGTTVWASSAHSRKAGEPKPDFGLYLASSWGSNADCLAYYVNWQDYGLPNIDWKIVVWAIENAFESAKTINVEVGCVGGHGRTGTVLACMATLAGVKPQNAVKWVRKHYCEHAVESDDQAWFVKWFDATRRGVKAPKRPVKKSTTSSTVKSTSGGGLAGGNSFGMQGKKCKRTDCNMTAYAAHGYCYKDSSLASDGDSLPDAVPLKKVTLDTEKMKKCRTPECVFHFKGIQSYCAKCREDRAKEFNGKLPTCPICDTKMIYNTNLDDVLCLTMNCACDYAVESPEFGWVFYDMTDEELGSERGDLMFKATANADIPNDEEIDRLVQEWEDKHPLDGEDDNPLTIADFCEPPKGIEDIIDDIQKYTDQKYTEEDQEYQAGLEYAEASGPKDCAFCKKPLTLSYNHSARSGHWICFNLECEHSPSDEYLNSLPGVFIMPDKVL